MQQPEEFLHAARSVEQTFVHIHVNDVGATFDLLASNADRFVIFFLANQPGKSA